MDDFIKNILSDTKVKLSEEFDRNFERKAFFDKKWAQVSRRNNRGSLMLRTGRLRKSITSTTNRKGIRFYSNHPAAALHNAGGTITVTGRMKRYFWAMFKKTNDEFYKGMALKKQGSKIRIPQRQFIGHHQQTDRIIRKIIDYNFQEQIDRINKNIKQ